MEILLPISTGSIPYHTLQHIEVPTPRQKTPAQEAESLNSLLASNSTLKAHSDLSTRASLLALKRIRRDTANSISREPLATSQSYRSLESVSRIPAWLESEKVFLNQTNAEIALERIRLCKENQTPELDLSGLGLHSLPAGKFQGLAHLRKLNLSDNKLQRLPVEIEQLPQLQMLNVHRNPLTALPQRLGKLPRLEGFEGFFQDTPPTLDLLLKPHATSGGDSYLNVKMTLEAPRLATGDALVRLPLRLVGIPSARYDGNALTASDDLGPLPLSQQQEPETPEGIYRRWNVTRATQGNVVVSFRAPPRVVTAGTNNGPVFDLREENGGFTGAGLSFMATPAKPGLYKVRLRWDLSHAPAGSRGVWSFGEGDVDAVVPSEALSSSYYAAGPLHSFPTTTQDSKFGLYWLTPPPFHGPALGQWIQKLYDSMSRFFGDTHSTYRVFIRQNPYHGLGGTALGHSFMLGYNAPSQPTIDQLKGIIAHEMVHTWPTLEGTHSETAWYSEGIAEYYAMLLPYRAGLLTTDQLLAGLNAYADEYYTSPTRNLTAIDVAKRFWKDPIAQQDPYSRGLVYFVQTDAAIRAKSGGKRSLDDVVLELYRRSQRNEPYGISQWLELVGKEIGVEQAKAAYDQMVSGKTLILPKNPFSPCLDVVKQGKRVFELGYVRSTPDAGAVVSELKPDSAAAQAGMKNGDLIVQISNFSEARVDDKATVSVMLKRDGKEFTVTYVPRGHEVDSYQWKSHPENPDSSCSF